MAWKKYPFKTYRHTVVSSSAQALQQQASPLRLPSHKPTKAEVDVLKGAYPDWKDGKPPWGMIEADLLALGMTSEAVGSLTAEQAVRIVKSRSEAPTDKTDGKAKGSSSKRGPRTRYSAKDDKKLVDDWKAAKAKHSTKAEFARARGVDQKVLDDTLSRVRIRKNRDN